MTERQEYHDLLLNALEQSQNRIVDLERRCTELEKSGARTILLVGILSGGAAAVATAMLDKLVG